MRKERHIYFDEDVYKAITDYSLSKSKSINESVIKLVSLGLETDSSTKLVNEFKNNIIRIEKNSYLTFSLLKQVYSDLGFHPSNITNVNESEALDIFFRKIKKDKYND